jgi:hypothetical protein
MTKRRRGVLSLALSTASNGWRTCRIQVGPAREESGSFPFLACRMSLFIAFSMKQ